MKKRIRIYIGLSVALFVGVCVCVFSLEKFVKNNQTERQIDFHEVVHPSFHIDGIKTPSWYFFYNNKMYAYRIEEGHHQFYSTDLYGKNIEVLSEVDELSYPHFWMRHDDEVFYYTDWSHGINKINLTTGEVAEFVKDMYLYMFPDTLADGKVLVNYQNFHMGENHAYFAYLDIETGMLSDEKLINYVSPYGYYYCMDNKKAYYIDISGDKNKICVDNEIIHSYDSDNNHSDFVFVQDNYLFAVVANKLLKFELSDYSLVEERELGEKFGLMTCERVDGGGSILVHESTVNTSIYPLFQGKENGHIYKFNSETLCFEKVIEADGLGGFVQKYGDYFILQGDSKTAIYNEKNNEYKIFNSANYSVEGNDIYLMTYTSDLWHQKESDLEFRIEKISFDNIFE